MEMGWVVFKMLFALSLVLGLLFLLVRLLKRTPLIRKDLPTDFDIRILTTKPISPRKYISLVEIGGEVLALGISEAQISYLTKIENAEWLEKWRRETPPAPVGTLPAWMGNFPLKKRKIISSSEERR
jgi:flagellar biogenesis protein FliO